MIKRPILGIVMWCLTVLVCIAALATSYAGHVNPTYFPFASVLVMVTPLTLLLVPVILVADIFARKIIPTVIAGITLFACAGAFLENYPLTFGHSAPEDLRAKDTTEFTLMTYNAAQFLNAAPERDVTNTPVVSYILEKNADIVCLQEAREFQYLSADIGRAQFDSLAARYPYMIPSEETQLLLSKFPATRLPVNFDAYDGVTQIGAYALNIRGRRVALFNVHLHSFGLTGQDKETYRKLMRGRADKDSVKSELIYKIERAAVARARQVEELSRAIQKYGGENVIVCGDFNDVPGSWPLMRLRELGLEEVYPRVGTGYMRTFRLNGMYFRIDHILATPTLEPLWIHRGNEPLSDHYPLITAFKFE